VLDVWFDSRIARRRAVLAARPELKWPADAYLEAVEQGARMVWIVADVRDRRPGRRPFSKRRQPRAHDR